MYILWYGVNWGIRFDIFLDGIALMTKKLIYYFALQVDDIVKMSGWIMFITGLCWVMAPGPPQISYQWPFIVFSSLGIKTDRCSTEIFFLFFCHWILTSPIEHHHLYLCIYIIDSRCAHHEKRARRSVPPLAGALKPWRQTLLAPISLLCRGTKIWGLLFLKSMEMHTLHT